MSTVLLKAAPEAAQLADRLAHGVPEGIEVCLAGAHVAGDDALAAAVATVRSAVADAPVALTAEAPVAWPSGAFVRVDRLDAEARAGIERSAAFAAAIGSAVLTIHLFVPLAPAEFRARGALRPRAVERFLRFYADACLARGVRPLIENVPPVLRMRQGGVFLSPVGGHWRDMLEWRRRVPDLGFTLDVSHAALFAAAGESFPGLFGLRGDEDLAPERYVDELAPATAVAHVSDARGILGEGLPVGTGELDVGGLARRLDARGVELIVAEVNEPDPARSGAMRAGAAAIRAALDERTAPAERPRRRPAAPRPLGWQAVAGVRDPAPAVLDLQARFGGRRVVVTGGGGSIGRALAGFLLAFRPEAITLLDSHEGSLAADRRARRGPGAALVRHVLCDIRDRVRLDQELARARPDVVFHLAAYKHVDWAERYPDEYVETNLGGAWNLLAAADAAGVDTVVAASTDKAALAASLYGRTKRVLEQLVAFSAVGGGRRRLALRFVNVLGSAGSASEIFLEQARAGGPLTVTDPAMTRYWITPGHAVVAAAHAALLAAAGERLATPAAPPLVGVGALAARVWRAAGRRGAPPVAVTGIRPGETLAEHLLGPGEETAPVRWDGVEAVRGDAETAAAAWAVERLAGDPPPAAAREVWREALRRPGLIGGIGAPARRR